MGACRKILQTSNARAARYRFGTCDIAFVLRDVCCAMCDARQRVKRACRQLLQQNNIKAVVASHPFVQSAIISSQLHAICKNPLPASSKHLLRAATRRSCWLRVLGNEWNSCCRRTGSCSSTAAATSATTTCRRRSAAARINASHTARRTFDKKRSRQEQAILLTVH